MTVPSNVSRSRESLLHDLRRVQSFIDDKDFSAALTLALTVRAEAKSTTGRESAFASFLAAIAADMGGNPEVAFGYISEAISLDPLALPFQHSFGVIVGRIRGALIAPDREAADPAIERLHGLLLNAGKADAECHLALVRHYVATDRLDAAFKLVDALSEVFPTCAEAWAAKMTIARSLGREDVARQCEVGRRSSASLSALPVNMPGAKA